MLFCAFMRWFFGSASVPGETPTTESTAAFAAAVSAFTREFDSEMSKIANFVQATELACVKALDDLKLHRFVARLSLADCLAPRPLLSDTLKHTHSRCCCCVL